MLVAPFIPIRPLHLYHFWIQGGGGTKGTKVVTYLFVMLLNFILEITLLKANVYWIIFTPNMMKSAVCFQESTLKGIQGNTLFVTLIDHLPIIKQIPQFVIK